MKVLSKSSSVRRKALFLVEKRCPSDSRSRKVSMDAVDEAIEADVEMGVADPDADVGVAVMGPALPPPPEGSYIWAEPIQYVSGVTRYFKKGVHLPPMVKLLLLQVGNNLRRLWDNGTRKMRRISPTQTWTQFLKSEFKALTGFDFRRFYEYQSEARKNGGFLVVPEDRGVKPRKLEVEVSIILFCKAFSAQLHRSFITLHELRLVYMILSD